METIFSLSECWCEEPARPLNMGRIFGYEGFQTRKQFKEINKHKDVVFKSSSSLSLSGRSPEIMSEGWCPWAPLHHIVLLHRPSAKVSNSNRARSRRDQTNAQQGRTGAASRVWRSWLIAAFMECDDRGRKKPIVSLTASLITVDCYCDTESKHNDGLTAGHRNTSSSK